MSTLKKAVILVGSWIVTAFGVASQATSASSTVHLPPAVGTAVAALGPAITTLEYYLSHATTQTKAANSGTTANTGPVTTPAPPTSGVPIAVPTVPATPVTPS